MTGSCLAENFCTQWVAERKRGELGEKAEGSFRMGLRGSCPHKEGDSREVEIRWEEGTGSRLL